LKEKIFQIKKGNKKLRKKTKSISPADDEERRLFKNRLKERENISKKDLDRLIYEFKLQEQEIESLTSDLVKNGDALQKVRKNYSALYDFVPLGYFSFDKEGIILEANITLASMLGIKRKDLMKRPFPDFIVEKARDSYFSYINRIYKSRRPISCETLIKTKDGTNFYARLKSIVIRDREGNFIQGRMTVSDITGYKEVQNSLYYRLSMEKLVTNISTAFINVDYDEIEREIKSALKTIGEFVGVERCYIYLFSEDLSEITYGYEWHIPGGRSMIKNITGLSMEPFSWSTGKYRNFEPLYISSLSELPREADFEKKYWKNSGVSSVLSFPLYSRKRLMGILGFIDRKSVV